jgi:hypothetical protein
MAEQPSLVDLVIDVNDRLTAAGIGHGFGGAIALAYYTADPRATRDMDINVSSPADAAGEVLEQLPAAVRWDARDVEACRRDGQVRLWVGTPRSGIPVDLFFPQHRFHAAVAEATTLKPFARPDYFLPVIAGSHLLVFKTLFNRPQDWVDIAAMLRVGTVDLAESLRWLDELLGSDDELVKRVITTAAAARALTEEEAVPRIDWRKADSP